MLRRQTRHSSLRRRRVCTRYMKLHRLARVRRKQLASRGVDSPQSARRVLAVEDADDDDDEEMPQVEQTVSALLSNDQPSPSAASGKASKRGAESSTTCLAATETTAAADGTSEKPRRLVTLLPSVFEGRGPVLFFSYTSACGATQRPMQRAVHTGPEVPKMYYAHTDKVHEYNAVINILRQGGLYRLRADSHRWSLLWSNHPPPETLRAIKPCQKTNHFPGSHHLGRKDLIWRNIARMKTRYGAPYEITPEVFILPREMESFDATRSNDPEGLWIWKPCSSSCGRGIKVLSSSIAQEEARELGRKRGIIQRYVPEPLLIDGYKFDLRIYVVVLSYDPLKIYINDEGLVRIATEKYSNSPESLSSRTMHLTNYSVNKQSDKFVQNTDGRGAKTGVEKETKGGALNEEEEGSRAFKWSLAELKEYFKQKGLDYEKMTAGIEDVVIKTCLAVELPLRSEWSKALLQEEEGWSARGENGCHRSSCFEIYGFDVLMDSAMKAWLLEVNICPSLSSGSPLDKRIKTKLVADSLTLAGIRPPPSMWRQNREAAQRASRAGVMEPDSKDCGTSINSMTQGHLELRSGRLLACKSAFDAVALFDQADWDLVLDAHDEDFRCGGLKRIYPAVDSDAYVAFQEEESYCNIVLRKWQEAGGGELFTNPERSRLLPPWVPRQLCFSRT